VHEDIVQLTIEQDERGPCRSAQRSVKCFEYAITQHFGTAAYSGSARDRIAVIAVTIVVSVIDNHLSRPCVAHRLLTART
jgi:hypothetical protein